MWLDIHIHKEAKYYTPYLDGEKKLGCFAGNEEEGWIDCYKSDDFGHYILSEDKTSLLTERLYGKVEFKREY